MGKFLKFLKEMIIIFLILMVANMIYSFFVHKRQKQGNPVALIFGDYKMGAIVNADQIKELGWSMNGDFQVSDGGFILLQTKDSIVNLIDGEPILSEPRSDLRSFCVVGEGVVAACGKWLCGYDSNAGSLQSIVELPSEKIMLAKSGDPFSFYLYENTDQGGDIYKYSAGGSYSKLLHTERPILAITGYQGRIFFSVWDKIFTWKRGVQVVKILDLAEALNQNSSSPITSLAIDPTTGYLFFSSGEGVYCLANGNPFLLLAGISGDLQFSMGRLFIKDRVQKAILEMDGISKIVYEEVRNTQKAVEASFKKKKTTSRSSDTSTAGDSGYSPYVPSSPLTHGWDPITKSYRLEGAPSLRNPVGPLPLVPKLIFPPTHAVPAVPQPQAVPADPPSQAVP